MAKKKSELNQQQIDFLANYCNPNNGTFGNAYQSAVKAGYSTNYAESITSFMPDWLLENMGDMRRLHKAEKVLDEMLEMDTVNTVETEDGEYTKVDTGLVKIKQDTAKFVASTIGKAKYATRSEQTGKDGGAIIHQIAGMTISKDV
jgi:hypothetical protein